MKLAFSTLGCPHWELERIAQAARAYGYAAVELRAIAGDLDLLNRPEFQPGTVEKRGPGWLMGSVNLLH
jgi:fatty-acyl-CoA synthase